MEGGHPGLLLQGRHHILHIRSNAPLEWSYMYMQVGDPAMRVLIRANCAKVSNTTLCTCIYMEGGGAMKYMYLERRREVVQTSVFCVCELFTFPWKHIYRYITNSYKDLGNRSHMRTYQMKPHEVTR